MPIFLLIVMVLVLSQSGIWIRLASLDPAIIGFWRMLLASLILIPAILYQKQWRQLTHISRSNLRHVFLCGTLLFIHFYLWFSSVQKTTVANAMVYFTLNPVFTAFGAWIFFREKISVRHLASMILGFSGVVWMMRESFVVRPELFLGDVLGFLCALAFSAYVLSGKYLRNRMDNAPLALGIYIVCGVWFMGAMLLLGAPFSGYSNMGWIGIAGLTIGSTLLGHFLLMYIVKFLNVNLISCATLVEPVFTAITAYWLFSEPVSRGTVIGFILIALGVLVLYSPKRRAA